MELIPALKQLDPKVDEHWTADGLPRIDAVSAIMGSPTDRSAIREAAPDLTREAMAQYVSGEPIEPAKAPEVEAAPPPAVEPPVEEKPGIPIPPTASAPRATKPVGTTEAEIMASSFDEMAQSPEALAEFVRIVDEKAIELTRQIAGLTERRKALYGKSETASMLLSRIRKVETGTEGIRDFLDMQRKTREERAERLRSITESGFTPEEIAKAIDPRSELDRALSSTPQEEPRV